MAPAVDADARLLREGDFWRLDVSDMPDLRPGDVYQVWLRDGERLQPSVLFTQEPSGGSEAPTTDPMISAAEIQ